ncbi:MAG: hypothetical protein K2W95_30775 [Candidatus Obscuribacterales bacterium]|nr:hypothetical protein [Candidatus Obscuribacterales bacterium]
MSKSKVLRELLISVVTLFAIFHACKSIVGSVEHQLYLHKQSGALITGQEQARLVNKELRDGLANYRSSSGIERLARERLNLAGSDEIIVRTGK